MADWPIATDRDHQTTWSVPTASHDRGWKYRPDIDGLRAVAVLAVLGFHGFPLIFRGGFVGVDVFFVISGYLITGIIRAELERKTFSLATFYARRIRRIFPALLLVLTVTLAVGWHLLLDGEFRRLGKHAVAGAGFASNFVLWAESGYFDKDASLKPLLHLWSLGIEEQFYIVWPLVLLLSSRWPGKAFLTAAAIVAASFIFNIYAVETSPAEAFYSPLGRAWELGLGTLLALTRTGSWLYPSSVPAGNDRSANHNSMLRDRIALLGSIMIGAAVFGLNKYSSYPGGFALLPTLGTGALIWAGPGAWFNAHVLARRALVGIGLISYPLYLWHWPLLAFERIVQPQGVSHIAVAASLACSFLLAWATYRLIEVPMRRYTWSPRVLVVGMLMLAAGAVCCLSGMIQPRSTRFGLEKIVAVERDEAFPGRMLQPFEYRGQTFYREGSGIKTTVFVGDSTMQQNYLRVDAVFRARAPANRRVSFATSHGCPPIAGVEAEKTRRYCGAFAQAAALYADEPDVDVVVIGAHWHYYFGDTYDYVNYVFNDGSTRRLLGPDTEGSRAAMASLGRWIARLTAHNKTVYLILDAPFGDQLAPENLMRRSLWAGFEVLPAYIDQHAFARLTGAVSQGLRSFAEANGATVIDPLELLCDGTRCPALTVSGYPMYNDRVHLRSSFVRDNVTYLDAAVVP